MLSWAVCPESEPTPPGDILVLALTVDSYTVYKTAIVMCGILSLILLLFRVVELNFRAAHLYWRESADAASGWFVASRTDAAETRHDSDIVVERVYEH